MNLFSVDLPHIRSVPCKSSVTTLFGFKGWRQSICFNSEWLLARRADSGNDVKRLAFIFSGASQETRRPTNVI